MRCSCFGGPSVDKKRGSAAETLHGIDGDLLQDITTDNFHSSNKIGRGGFGDVYKAWELHEEGRPLELVDPEMGEFPEEEVIRYIKVAFFCTQSAANRRPLTGQVVDMLSKQIRLNDKLLTAPGFFRDSDSASGGPSSMKKSSTNSTSYQMSSVPVTITEVTPR
ncbi:hypothetical protein NC651_010295 [Populus alba x Populus x berolinensis]|nr:hypothetical protein NC651_010295 [Populus alba x Populus x berolinensis]